MRNTFINELFHEAKKNKDIQLLTGDLGFGVLDQFKDKLPEQFLNTGINEQLMTSMAAGMALTGKTVFTYSIANFPTLRCYEQIRNDICYHNLDVKIISIGAGVAYGTHGYTHFGVEDIAALNALPNMKIVCPSDPVEAKKILPHVLKEKGPCYIRLGKNKEPSIHDELINPTFGRAVEIYESSQNYIISTGSIGYNAFLAAKELRKEGNKIGLATLPWVNPLDTTFLEKLISNDIKNIFTVEEHRPTGGLHSIISSFISKEGSSIKVSQLSLPDKIEGIGSQSYLLNKYLLDKDGIKEKIRNAL